MPIFIILSSDTKGDNKKRTRQMLGLQRRECELRYECYIESTEHMNTGEGWRGMGSNDELNLYIYVYIICSSVVHIFIQSCGSSCYCSILMWA